MNAKELLYEISGLRTKIKFYNNLIKSYKENEGKISGENYSSDIVSTTRNNKAIFEKWYYKRKEAEEKKEAILKVVGEKEVLCDKYLVTLGEELSTLAHLRYYDIETWDNVASIMSVAIRTAYRYNRDLLNKLEKIKVGS